MSCLRRTPARPWLLIADSHAAAGYAEPTLADWRLYGTLIRFDAVYYARMKVNMRYIRQFPHLQARVLVEARRFFHHLVPSCEAGTAFVVA